MSYGGSGKQGLPIKEAVEEIRSQVGTEFDLTVVSALITSCENGTLFNNDLSILQ